MRDNNNADWEAGYLGAIKDVEEELTNMYDERCLEWELKMLKKLKNEVGGTTKI